jgi:hypothetical protein
MRAPLGHTHHDVVDELVGQISDVQRREPVWTSVGDITVYEELPDAITWDGMLVERCDDGERRVVVLI